MNPSRALMTFSSGDGRGRSLGVQVRAARGWMAWAVAWAWARGERRLRPRGIEVRMLAVGCPVIRREGVLPAPGVAWRGASLKASGPRLGPPHGRGSYVVEVMERLEFIRNTL